MGVLIFTIYTWLPLTVWVDSSRMCANNDQILEFFGMRSPILMLVSASFLSGCGTSLSGLSDAELRAQHEDCQFMGGSRKIKAMTCSEVAKECEIRRKAGRRVCR